MHLNDKSLRSDARNVAEKVKEVFSGVSQEHEDIRKGVDHIVNVLENTSKSKLKSAAAKARSLS